VNLLFTLRTLKHQYPYKLKRFHEKDGQQRHHA
jgi:hypothetical protein